MPQSTVRLVLMEVVSYQSAYGGFVRYIASRLRSDFITSPVKLIVPPGLIMITGSESQHHELVAAFIDIVVPFMSNKICGGINNQLSGSASLKDIAQGFIDFEMDFGIRSGIDTHSYGKFVTASLFSYGVHHL